MQFVARGGGNGDDIRLGILNIMKENTALKKATATGHRRSIHRPVAQKVTLKRTTGRYQDCEAYFLHTGNWDDFWTHLENAKLTRRFNPA